MKLDKRLIVRKRTQQLVYLELGRDNGGVMLNLSEEGCSFQAITPVKCGETRFAFQISGGRRIAGEAEVMWVDDVGIMGGLRFLNLPAEARKQVRLWLQETNAPDEHGTLEPADTTRSSRMEASREAIAEAAAREYRSSPYQAGGGMAAEEAPPASAWAHLRAASSPAVHDERFTMPMLREDGSYGSSRARAVALWRALAVLATAAAIGLLLMAYQHEVGASLIWLGESLSGKTKASVVTPDTKPATPSSSPEASTPAASNPGTSGSGSSDDAGLPPQTSDAQKATRAGVGAAPRVPDAEVPPESQPARLDSTNGGGQQSVLEKQLLRDTNKDAWDSSDTVESLWSAVQSGSVSAERTLAERFVHGEGVIQNCEQAKVLLRAAANRGSKEARLRLYELETQGCH
jgi:TPR repeat protein